MISPSPHRSEFQRAEGTICLNHAGVAPIPRRTAAKIARLADYMTRRGAFRYAELEAEYERARARCAALIDVEADSLAFVRNTSEGLSWVALGLDWRAGDEIVTSDQEFPTNLVVWLDTARRSGVTVHQVPSGTDGSVSADALLERVNARTRLVTISSVQFGSGALVDLARLGAALRGSDTLLVVDGVQSLGVLPMPVRELGIDALSSGGHKWLLAPEGCGLFYLSEKGLDQVHPRVLGWHSVANAGNYEEICIDPRPGARRFEAGTANVLGAAALAESIDLLREAGPGTVRERVRGLGRAFVDGLKARGCVIDTPLAADGAPAAGLLYFRHPRLADRRLHLQLAAAGVEQVARARGIRFAPHYYQDDDDVAETLARLDHILEVA